MGFWAVLFGFVVYNEVIIVPKRVGKIVWRVWFVHPTLGRDWETPASCLARTNQKQVLGTGWSGLALRKEEVSNSGLAGDKE